jgi:hypothetical protein
VFSDTVRHRMAPRTPITAVANQGDLNRELLAVRGAHYRMEQCTSWNTMSGPAR